MAPVASAVPKAISTAVFTNKITALGSLAEETGVPVSVLVAADPQEVLSCIVDNRAKLVNEQRKRNEQDLIRAQLRRRLEQASFNVPGGRADRMLDAQLAKEQQQLLMAQLAAGGGTSEAAAAAGTRESAAVQRGGREGAIAGLGSSSASSDLVAPLETATSPAPEEPASASPFTTPAAPATSTLDTATSSPQLRPLQARASTPPGPGATVAHSSLMAAALAPALNSPGVASPSCAASVASSSSSRTTAAVTPTAQQQPVGRLPLLLARMSAAATSSTAPGSPALPSHLARAAASMDGTDGQSRGAAAASSSPALAEPAASVLRRSSSRSAQGTLRDVSNPSTTAFPSPSTAPLVRRSINGLPPARPSSSGVGGGGSGGGGVATGDVLAGVAAAAAVVSIGNMPGVGRCVPRTSGSGYGSSGNSPGVTGSAAFVGPADSAAGTDVGGARPPSRLRDASPLHPPRPPPLALPPPQALLLQQQQQLQPQPGEALPHHSCPGELVLPSPHSAAPSPLSQATARAVLMMPRRSCTNLVTGAPLQGPGPGWSLGESGSSPGGAVGAVASRVTVPPLRPSARSRAQSDCGVQAPPLQSQPSTPGAAAPETTGGEMKDAVTSSATASSPKLPPLSLNQTSRRTLQLGAPAPAGTAGAGATGSRQATGSPARIWRV